MRKLFSVAFATGILAISSRLDAQFRQEPGQTLGTVTTRGNLIVLTLKEGVLGREKLFTLQHRTLRFTPIGSRYEVENLPGTWDRDFGPQLTEGAASLKSVRFPFSGQTWSSLYVGVTGNITFGEPAQPAARRGGGGNGPGLSIDRFAELQQAASTLINTVPALCVFFKPRMSGMRYVKELADRVVVTWSLTEPSGGVQDWTWTQTVNEFQAVLYADGKIDFNYHDVAAKDAIVGVYPLVKGAESRELGVVSGLGAPSLAPHLDLVKIHLAAEDGLFLKTTFETRGPVLAEGDAGLGGLNYRVCLNHRKPAEECSAAARPEVMWTVQGGGGRGGAGRAGGAPRYNALGEGVQPGVEAKGNTLAVQGTLASSFKPGDEIYVSAAVASGAPETAPASHIAAQQVKLTGLGSPELDFATVKKGDGPFAVGFEAYHYLKPPRANDLTCSVLRALGDHFDMLAFYSDFRIDNPEAGTSSTGPLGGGPGGGEVTGIGAKQRNLASFCTQGRFQWQFIQPVYVGANQMQEYPPQGLVENNTHNVVTYTKQLAERTANGKIPPYDYAISQIGHEMGHRWSAFVSARVGSETLQLGPTHWARGLHAPVAFPYQRPTEASAMGGGVWQDNFDGTFTQLDDDYYVPATGWSYLDLYLMGFIAPAEVPDFFLLRNLQLAAKDANGAGIFKADRTKVTINDVIAMQGPRVPDVEHSQRAFNTGMVVVVEHGTFPSKELLDRTEGIRERWMDYWTTTTGHRSTMTTDVR